MRRFDWVFYALLIAMVVWAIYGGDRRAPAPVIPPDELALDDPDAPPLAPPSAFDPQVRVEIPFMVVEGSGTAFSAGDGVWLTARHVVDGCKRVGLVVQGGRGVEVGDVDASARSDLAVLYAGFRRDPLPFALDPRELSLGEYGYHVGYPQGRPGEAASRLMGREVLVARGRYRSREPVLAWAEWGRTRGLAGSLGGMSGGPTLDAHGRVIGVTIAESPRRGRIYTAAPRSVGATLLAAGETPGERASDVGAFTPRNYGERASNLRRSRRVAQVVCLVR